MTKRRNSAWLRWVMSVVGVAVWGAMAMPQAASAACVLTCPADVALTTQSSAGTAFTYAAPSQAGCSGSVEQTSGLVSGSVFPPGMTINSFRDTVSTDSTCAFTVTVRYLPQHLAPAAGPLGLAALAGVLVGLGAWAAARRRRA